MKIYTLIFTVFFIQSCSQINNKIDSIMNRQYYINTAMGMKNCNDLIAKGYQYVDENRLINPKPMTFNNEELNWIKKNLYDFVKKSYSVISKEALIDIQNLNLETIKSRAYIFSNYFYEYPQDVYLLKIKDKDSKVYNIYMIKYIDEEFIENDKGEAIDSKLVKKVRFENESWYRNFFSDEQEYLKSKY